MDKFNIKRQERVLKRNIDTLDGLGFEYIGGYVTQESPMLIRCKKCGAESTVTGDYLHRAVKGIRKYQVVCKACEKELQKRIKQRQREQEKMNRAMAKQETVAFVYNECIECGQPFFANKRMKYCSDRCNRRHDNRVHYESRSYRLKKVRVDKDISLEKLYQEEKGICYLCGGMCDWNDYVMVGQTFVAGNNYPSIEHVKPLSKGGLHCWDNVRLAHRVCNSYKRDKYNPLVGGYL